MIKILNTVNQNEVHFDNESYFINSKDFGSIQGIHHTSKGLNQNGEYYTGSNLETRDISISGYIIASSKAEMDIKKRKLIRCINPLETLNVIYDEYKLEGVPSSTVKFSTDSKNNNNFICAFIIDVFCPNPFFIPLTESKTEIALWKGSFHFPLIIPNSTGVIMGFKEPNLIVNIINNGDIKTGMRIEFKAIGSLSNPSLFNVNTREYIKINKSMVAGEVIEVTTNYGRKKVTNLLNGISTNILHFLDLNSTFLQLDVGDNLFRYDADTNPSNLEVNIYYNPRYLGV